MRCRGCEPRVLVNVMANGRAGVMALSVALFNKLMEHSGAFDGGYLDGTISIHRAGESYVFVSDRYQGGLAGCLEEP